MVMTPDSKRKGEGDEVVDKLAGFARRATESGASPREQDIVRRLEVAFEQRLHRRNSRRWVALLVAGLGLALAVGVLVLSPSRPLNFEVSGGSTSGAGYVSCSEESGGAVRFSDHSEVGLEHSTRLRVSHVEPRGARILLEAGVLHAHIQHGAGSRWAFEAGPYTVHVTGTDFDLSWQVAEQALEVALRNGSVLVEGPLLEGGLKMVAGQHLTARPGDAELSIADERAARAAGAPMAAAASAESQSGSIATPARPPTASVDAPASPPASARTDLRGWRAKIARGDFQEIVDDAERQGLDRTLAEASTADLAALADAARYARRSEIARRALTAQRARHADSLQARDAAFFLGGLAEAQDEEAAAIDWYDVYLRESPKGTYASQAMGRKMLLVQKTQGTAAARPIASDILQRFPGGPYEATAQKLRHLP
jgi:hypothetical protein